ncbi:MAG: AGE family epimerase/isomerase [Planctomycetes bacterium]|nr:AGE family epimerase/isomerase [Planctomycetota bacterium]
MTVERLRWLGARYRSGLLEQVLPFWLRHAVDREHGGFITCLDRDGTVVDTDKGIWVQGRFAWLLATLYAEVEPRPEWLELARHGVEFLRRHGFDADGRMFFQVTRDGRPLRKRRYLFSECFTIAAFAALARASGDERARDDALELFRRVCRYVDDPSLLPPPKVDARTRPCKGLALPMITIVTAQILRRVCDDPLCTERIDRAVHEIEHHFMHPELAAVLEVVGPHGEYLDHFDGRTLNPGHAIEAAWFLLEEARLRGGDQSHLVRLGTTILDWMWPRGWDPQHGGILYFVDVHGGPVQEYWHDMKFWWPQNEATIATLMAWAATGEPRYASWHRQIDDWMHAHYPDPEHGEWFGYLHRDGRLSSSLKGGLWKGPFHIPRMQLRCWQLCEELAARAADVAVPAPRS